MRESALPAEKHALQVLFSREGAIEFYIDFIVYWNIVVPYRLPKGRRRALQSPVSGRMRKLTPLACVHFSLLAYCISRDKMRSG